MTVVLQAVSSVTAVADLRRKNGGTRPHVLQCDDGRVYLVKFMDDTRSLINEYIGYAVAGVLGVPVPESRLVYVPEHLITDSDDLRSRGIKPGLHFGSLWEADSTDLTSLPMQELMNLPSACLTSLPGFIVLDNLVLNADRSNLGNSLLRKTDSGEYEFEAIDFNQILAGPRWTTDTMSQLAGTSSLMPTLPIMRLSVTGPEPFSPWLEAAEAISEEAIRDLLAEVPRSWNVSEEDKAAICHFILSRRVMVRNILASHRSTFANWT